MNEPLLLMGGYIIAAVFGVLYFMSRTSMKGSQDETRSALDQLEELKTKNKSLSQDVTRFKKDSEDRDSKLKQAEKDLIKLKERQEKQIAEFETVIEAQKQSAGKAESKTEHFKSQIEALTLQIQEVDSEKREIRIQLEDLTNSFNEKINARVSDLKKLVKQSDKKVRDLEQELKKKDSKFEKAQEKLKTADPVILKKAKVKLSHYAHLYKLMRGQKEMAEERNQNWELALRLMSSWILEHIGQSVQKDDNLGTLVASALEATRLGPLVDDNNGLGFPEDKAHPEKEHDQTDEITIEQAGLDHKDEPLSEEPYEKAVVVKKSETHQQS